MRRLFTIGSRGLNTQFNSIHQTEMCYRECSAWNIWSKYATKAADFALAIAEELAPYWMDCGLRAISSAKRLSSRRVANSASVYTFLMSL